MTQELTKRFSSELLLAPGFDVVPATVADQGDQAAYRILEFYAARISNPNTRKAYYRSAHRFFRWTFAKGLSLSGIRAIHVASYLESLKTPPPEPTTRGRLRVNGYSTRSIKQELSALRHLFDFFVVSQVVPINPVTLVRGPNFSQVKGTTPVLSDDEVRQLLEKIDTSSVLGLRDRALISVLFFGLARVGAAVAMNVEDYYPQGKRWWFCLREKRGKLHHIPVHHKAEEFLDAYIHGAKISDQNKGPLFRTAAGRTKQPSGSRMSTKDAWYMVRRRAKNAGSQDENRLSLVSGQRHHQLPRTRRQA